MSGLRKMMYSIGQPSTPPDGLVMLTDWNIQNLTISNGNDFSPTAGNALAWSPSYIEAGGIGILQARSHISIFGLGTVTGFQAYSDIQYGLYRAPDNTPNTMNSNVGTSYGSTVSDDPLLMRVRTDGSLIHQEFSIDNGITWTHIISPVTQPNVKLYAKIATDPGEYLNDVLVSGFSAPLLLTGATRYVPDGLTFVSENKYRKPGTGEYFIISTLTMPGDGLLATRFTADAGLSFYLVNADDAEEYCGFYINTDGTVTWENSSGDGVLAAPADNQFFILKRTSGNVSLLYGTTLENAVSKVNLGAFSDEAITINAIADSTRLYMYDFQGVGIVSQEPKYMSGFSPLALYGEITQLSTGLWTVDSTVGFTSFTTQYEWTDGGELAFVYGLNSNFCFGFSTDNDGDPNETQGIVIDPAINVRLVKAGNVRYNFTGTQPAIGDFIIMKRNGSACEYYKSTDGVTRTALTPPAGQSITFTGTPVVTGYCDDDDPCTIEYPQFKGLTAIVQP